jgi:hypothetical protein
VGFHGCGGEQYRNADRIMRKISLRTYIKYEWMFKQCQNIFTDKRLINAVYDKIENKIKRLVNIPENKVGLLELKIIQNEIWNTANRATRVNVLNQQQFYFAPFTEYQLSYSAYNYVPFLGNSFSFQIEMMKKLDPELAAVKINYGFNLLKGEPLKYKLIPYLFNSIPRSLFYAIYYKWKNLQTNEFQLKKFSETAHPFLLDLGKKIDLKKLSRNVDLGNNLNSFDYMLKNTSIK